MIEQRKRQDVHYLERIKGPITLRQDGTVGEMGRKDVERTVSVPGRIPGREHLVTKTVSMMGEVAIYASLGEYLSYERNCNVSHRKEGEKWTLDDMPQEVADAYYSWRDDGSSPDMNEIREAAVSRIASDDERQNRTIACRDCERGIDRYACRTSGYSKEFYAFPIARYGDDRGTYDVPLDIAEIIHLAPQAVSYEVRPEFDAAGKMSAKRMFVIRAQHIPKSYITGDRETEGLVGIAPGEVLEQDIEIVVDYWHENAAQSERMRQSYAHYTKFNTQTEPDATPTRYLEHLQWYVAQMVYQERKDAIDYDAKLKDLHAAVGKRGLGLAYEYAYAGMGDSDARIMLTKNIEGYLVATPITYTYETRAALDVALKYMNKEVEE